MQTHITLTRAPMNATPTIFVTIHPNLKIEPGQTIRVIELWECH